MDRQGQNRESNYGRAGVNDHDHHIQYNAEGVLNIGSKISKNELFIVTLYKEILNNLLIFSNSFLHYSINYQAATIL